MDESRAAPAATLSPAASKALGWVRRGLTVVALLFVALAGYDLVREWRGQPVSLRVAPVVGATAALVGFNVLSAYSWSRLLARMTSPLPPVRSLVALFLLSHLGRYVPGKVGLPALRIGGARALGISARVVTTSLLVEMLGFVVTGLTCAFALLAWAGARLPAALAQLSVAGAVGGVLSLVLLIVIDRRRLPGRLMKSLGLSGEGPLLPPLVPVLQLLAWCCWSAHGALLAWALGAGAARAPGAAGFVTLATVAGFLAFVAPSGIGVREAVISYGLSPHLGPAPALALALSSRALTLLVDVTTWALSRLWTR